MKVTNKMSAKQKAQELFSSYRFMLSLPNAPLGDMKDSIAKECALLAVTEIDEAIDFDWMEIQNLDREHAYWQQVKEEIQKL